MKFVALLCLIVVVWLLQVPDVVSRFLPVLGMLAASAIFSILSLAIVFAGINMMTIRNAKRYAHALRSSGYDVQINGGMIEIFTLLATIVTLLGPMIVLYFYLVYDKYMQMLEAGVALNGEWYHGVGGIALTYSAVIAFAFSSSIYIWWSSFLPLGREYKKLDAGGHVDLPRVTHRGVSDLCLK